MRQLIRCPPPLELIKDTVIYQDEINVLLPQNITSLSPYKFLKDEKFVIDESGSTEDEIKRVVGLCPSGALEIED